VDRMITRISGVCKDCFCNVYAVSFSHVGSVINDMKGGSTNTEAKLNACSQVASALLAGLAKSHLEFI